MTFITNFIHQQLFRLFGYCQFAYYHISLNVNTFLSPMVLTVLFNMTK